MKIIQEGYLLKASFKPQSSVTETQYIHPNRGSIFLTHRNVEKELEFRKETCCNKDIEFTIVNARLIVDDE